MEEVRPRRSKKAKASGADRNSVCSVCSAEQQHQAERFRICGGCKDKLGIRRYFCTRACQKADWKTHKEWCGSQDFWDYPHKPLLGADADFEQPAALRCQIALIDASPDVLYTIAPGTDDVLRFEIADKMLNVTFRRVRDKAFASRDPVSIAILGQTLVGAVEINGAVDGSARRVTNLLEQLEGEYGVHDVEQLIATACDAQGEDSLLGYRHEENIVKHPSDFWRAMSKSLD
ncbi:hypothetical protein B0H15DRAFT_300181 [Mycena belliarum]|uniref:MYND-type domain-containing protein n=1 Tax=Mycena belliarum TaxID=1033014 RepID=A0AAD6U2A7_9AGAR|nr:hypothetical protein B0H15DRAFT_300181 [Mycena belliae]